MENKVSIKLTTSDIIEAVNLSYYINEILYQLKQENILNSYYLKLHITDTPSIELCLNEIS